MRTALPLLAGYTSLIDLCVYVCVHEADRLLCGDGAGYFGDLVRVVSWFVFSLSDFFGVVRAFDATASLCFHPFSPAYSTTEPVSRDFLHPRFTFSFPHRESDPFSGGYSLPVNQSIVFVGLVSQIDFEFLLSRSNRMDFALIRWLSSLERDFFIVMLLRGQFLVHMSSEA